MKKTTRKPKQVLADAVKPLFNFTELDLLRFFLNNYLQELSEKEKATGKQQADIDVVTKTLDLLHEYAEGVVFSPAGDNMFSWDLKTTGDDNSPEEHKKKVAELVNYFEKAIELPAFKDLIVSWIIEPKRLKEEKRKADEKKTHRQSRTQMRYIAEKVGRDEHSVNLFTYDFSALHEAIIKQRAEDGELYKNKLGQKVAILSQLLLEYWQKAPDRDDSDYAEIGNISHIAKQLNTTNRDLKIYLIYLGGYQYPSIREYKEKKLIGMQFTKIFDVEFLYHDKYEEVSGLKSVNFTNLAMLIDTPVKKIRFKPQARFVSDIQEKNEKALNYINVNPNFIRLCLGLGQLAYKLICFMSANKPEYAIKESKLINALDLREQLKAQKPARVREQLAKAFKELQEAGHLQEYKLPAPGDPAGMYSWAYTSKYVLHEYTKKKLASPPADKAEYVDFNDESIPAEKRQEAFKAWLVDSKGISPAEAAMRAKAKYKAQEAAQS